MNDYRTQQFSLMEGMAPDDVSLGSFSSWDSDCLPLHSAGSESGDS